MKSIVYVNGHIYTYKYIELKIIHTTHRQSYKIELKRFNIMKNTPLSNTMKPDMIVILVFLTLIKMYFKFFL